MDLKIAKFLIWLGKKCNQGADKILEQYGE